MPELHDADAPRAADRGDHPRPVLLHRPRQVHGTQAGCHGKSATKTTARQATRLIVPSNATRDRAGPGAWHRSRGRSMWPITARRPPPLPPAGRGAGPPCHRAPRAAQQDVRRVPRLADAAQERLRPGHQGGALAVADIARPRPRWCLAAGAAGARSSMRPSRVPSHLRLPRPAPATSRSPDLTGFLGGALDEFRGTLPWRGVRPARAFEAMACGASVLTTYEPRALRGRRRRGGVHRTGRRIDRHGAPRPARRPGQRAALGVAGYARAQEFTWAASATAWRATSGPPIKEQHLRTDFARKTPGW